MPGRIRLLCQFFIFRLIQFLWRHFPRWLFVWSRLLLLFLLQILRWRSFLYFNHSHEAIIFTVLLKNWLRIMKIFYSRILSNILIFWYWCFNLNFQIFTHWVWFYENFCLLLWFYSHFILLSWISRYTSWANVMTCVIIVLIP